MKNKILALALSLSFIATGVNNSYASEKDMTKEAIMTTTSKSEMREYLFDVTKIEGDMVSLKYAGEKTKDALVTDVADQDTMLKLSKALFAEDLALKDKVKIKSSKALKEIKAEEITKENVSIDTKYKKPENTEKDKLPKEAMNMDFVVKEISDDPVNPSATLYEVGNEANLYALSIDQLRDDDVKVGNKYKIYWDGISLESYPAQFGQIYRVEKLESKNEENQVEKKEFEVVEKYDQGVKVAEVGNKDNVYNISHEDLKDEKPEIGDRYMITWSGNSTKSDPAQFIDIVNVEKTLKKEADKAQVNKDELKKSIEEADKKSAEKESYTQASLKTLKDALSQAKEIASKETASQEEVDKVTKSLKDAIAGLMPVADKNMEMTKVYEIVEINGQGEDKHLILKEKDNKDALYTMSYKMLGDKDAKVGDRYEIKTDGIILPSNPAQFGKVLSVKKITDQKPGKKEENKKEDKKENKKEADKKAENKKEDKAKLGKGTNPKTGILPVAPLLGVIAGAATLLKKKFN